MNPYGGLLFNQGHVHDPDTARMLAGTAPAAGDGPDPATRPGTREDAARLFQDSGRAGGVELWTVLLSAFR